MAKGRLQNYFPFWMKNVQCFWDFCRQIWGSYFGTIPYLYTGYIESLLSSNSVTPVDARVQKKIDATGYPFKSSMTITASSTKRWKTVKIKWENRVFYNMYWLWSRAIALFNQSDESVHWFCLVTDLIFSIWSKYWKCVSLKTYQINCDMCAV